MKLRVVGRFANRFRTAHSKFASRRQRGQSTRREARHTRDVDPLRVLSNDKGSDTRACFVPDADRARTIIGRQRR